MMDPRQEDAVPPQRQLDALKIETTSRAPRPQRQLDALKIEIETSLPSLLCRVTLSIWQLDALKIKTATRPSIGAFAGSDFSGRNGSSTP
jgi:hypothetical protein